MLHYNCLYNIDNTAVSIVILGFAPDFTTHNCKAMPPRYILSGMWFAQFPKVISQEMFLKLRKQLSGTWKTFVATVWMIK